MKKNLKLLGVRFDPSLKTINVDVDTPIRLEVLADLVFEAFKKPVLLAYELPLQVLEMHDAVYYVFTWNVVGPVEVEKLGGRTQRLIHSFEGP